LGYKEFLDKLPPDIVRELAQRRLKELEAAGYEIKKTENV
jgi:hypothetical protein